MTFDVVISSGNWLVIQVRPVKTTQAFLFPSQSNSTSLTPFQIRQHVLQCFCPLFRRTRFGSSEEAEGIGSVEMRRNDLPDTEDESIAVGDHASSFFVHFVRQTESLILRFDRQFELDRTQTCRRTNNLENLPDWRNRGRPSSLRRI